MADRHSMRDFAEKVREYLQYNPETGIFLRIKKRKGGVRVGDRAGAVMNTGYRLIRLDGVQILEHRLAFLLMTGAIPEEIDHKNGNPADNRWTNLRSVRRSQNMWNAAVSKRNSSGRKGVSRHTQNGGWVARILVDGQTKHLGCFRQFSDAVRAGEQAEAKYHGEFVRTT